MKISVVYTRGTFGIRAVCQALKIEAEAVDYSMARSFITYQIIDELHRQAVERGDPAVLDFIREGSRNPLVEEFYKSQFPIQHIPEREEDIPSR